MEFWSENQGQYSKFGTIPGRHYTHNYHDRHQATQYPLYYGEQQDQGRSSYWTLPGSRTGGAPQEYTNWTDQELTAPAFSHFPFIIDRHPQQHQDLGYQPHEARDREWIAAQRATRKYERGYLREGEQRRWEQCSPVHYNREVYTKRSENSYRELEAWAARYSHSLPRRRRIEAELRGASQGLLESSRAPERDSRSGRDPRLTALQQVLQSANIRESGLWDRGGRQQTPTYYPSQTPATDTSHMLDTKEKTGYQRRMFSQPPGYIAPPPYNSPHKSSPVLHHSDTSWEQEGKTQTNWSQHRSSKQNVSIDHRKGEKDDFTKPDVNQYTSPELDVLQLQRQETTASNVSSPISIQISHTQCEDTLSLQQPQVFQAEINEEPSTKVIEGRKFRLNKKTGGMTIFCLVSRIAGTTETPSLPLCALQTNIKNAELGGDINQTHKLADEVDYRVPKLTEQPDTFHARNLKAQQETPICVENKLLEENVSNKAEAHAISAEKASTNDADSASGRQVAQSVQPISVKYPLWREPSFTSRAETESSSTCLEANNHEGDALHNQEVSAEVQPIDIEVRRLDIKEDTESEESILVVNTTCVAKIELIPPTKKEHVHYVDPKPHNEDSPLDIQSTTSPECVQSNSQLNQDVTIDQNAGTHLLNINERPETEPDSYLIGKKAPEKESEIPFPSMSSFSVSQRETLEERAERILGIPLYDCIIEQKHEEATLLLDSCVEDQEVEPSPVKDNDNYDDAAEKNPEQIIEEEQLENQSEVGQTEDDVCLKEKSDAKDQVVKEGGEDFAGSKEQMSTMSERNNIDSQLEMVIKASPESEIPEDPLLKSISEEGTEQSQEENEPVENITSSQHPSQCLQPNPTLSHMLFYISESNVTNGPNPELIALNSSEASDPETSSHPHIPLQQLLSPLYPQSGDFTAHSPSPSPLDLMDQTADAVSGIEYQDEEDEASEQTNNMLSDVPEDLAIDLTEELVSQQLQPCPAASADLVHISIPDRDHSPSPSPSSPEPMSSVEDQDEEGETSQVIINKISDPEDLPIDMTEELVSHQQYDNGQPDDVACVKEDNVIDEQQENVTEVNILQQLECIQAEDVVCVKKTYMTEEKLSEVLSENSINQIMTSDISNEESTKVNSLQQQLKSYITEEQLPNETDEDPIDLLEQTVSQENVTEGQIQTEVNILQQFECIQAEDVVSIKKTYMTEEQLSEEFDEETIDQIQIPEISEEDAIDVNSLQQQLEGYMTEEQLPNETNEGPTDLLEQTISQENVTQSQTEVNILHQQSNNGQEADTSHVKHTHINEEQLPKVANENPTGQKQTPKISKEDAIKVNSLQQQLKSYMTKEQLPNETDEDPIDLLEQTVSQENVTQRQTETNILQQQSNHVQEVDASCLKELKETEADGELIGLLEQTIAKENVTDSETLQDIEPQTKPSDSSPPSPSKSETSDCEASQSLLDALSPSNLPSLQHTSDKSDTEHVYPLETDLVCPSAINPDTATFPETAPHPLHLDSCEESLQLSSSSNSPPILLTISSTFPLLPLGSVSHLPLKEEPQYPQSLWDAVNRIRKHTAPDSETEEEEVSELWDPENVGDDLDSEKIVFDEAGQQVVLTEGGVEDAEVGQIQQDPCHEESSGYVEEDTLSCSSASSHHSGDTVILADDDEVDEMPPDADRKTESKADNDMDFQMAEGDRCCSGQVKDETADEEKDADESVTNESSKSDKSPVDVANTTTKAVEIMETEQKVYENNVFRSFEVSDTRMSESESVK